MHTCPVCHKIFGAIKSNGHCPECDALIAVPEEPRAESGSREEKIEVDGRRISKEEIQRMRGKREILGLQRELTDQQLARAVAATRQQKLAEYLRLKKVADQKGFKSGFAWHQYRETFGAGPPTGSAKFTDEELAQAVPADRPFFPLPRKTA
jgi:hypothetical protein